MTGKSETVIHITAHAGAEGTPANSMECLQKCVEIGVELAEVDLTFRKDGTPVLMHAGSAGESEGVPFDEALRYVAGASDTLRLNIDLKSVDNLPGLLACIEENGMLDRCFFTGVGEGWAEKVRADTEGKIPYYLNYGFPFWLRYSRKRQQEALRKVRDCGAVGLNSHYTVATAGLVKLFRQNGLKTSFWTVNRERDMRRLIAVAPDNITTRRPVRLRAFLEE